MTDEEVVEYFKEREALEGGDPEKILPIPEGEPMFMFCMIRGKTDHSEAFLMVDVAAGSPKMEFLRKN